MDTVDLFFAGKISNSSFDKMYDDFFKKYSTNQVSLRSFPSEAKIKDAYKEVLYWELRRRSMRIVLEELGVEFQKDSLLQNVKSAWNSKTGQALGTIVFNSLSLPSNHLIAYLPTISMQKLIDPRALEIFIDRGFDEAWDYLLMKHGSILRRIPYYQRLKDPIMWVSISLISYSLWPSWYEEHLKFVLNPPTEEESKKRLQVELGLLADLKEALTIDPDNPKRLLAFALALHEKKYGEVPAQDQWQITLSKICRSLTDIGKIPRKEDCQL